jgi:hypothetical protein
MEGFLVFLEGLRAPRKVKRFLWRVGGLPRRNQRFSRRVRGSEVLK